MAREDYPEDELTFLPNGKEAWQDEHGFIVRIDKSDWEKKYKDRVVSFLTSNKNHLRNVFDMQNLLVDAKDMIVRKLEKAKGVMDTFIRTENGYRVTAPEGFVAIDQMGDAVKLVDRLEFSRANFTLFWLTCD